jgi:hypothetical protein
MGNDEIMKAGFDHPCRQTCSGWRQGYERGVFESIDTDKVGKAINAAMNSALKINKELHENLGRHKKALDLALYYVEGDATWESLRDQVSLILKGEELPGKRSGTTTETESL